MHQLLSQCVPTYSPIICLRLDTSEENKQQEMRHIQSMFGTVTQGSVQFGEVKQVKNFHIGITWPTGMAIMKASRSSCNSDGDPTDVYAVAGKMAISIINLYYFDIFNLFNLLFEYLYFYNYCRENWCY